MSDRTAGGGSAGGPSADHGFVRNALSSYAVRGLLALSALLLTPYLFRRLGAGGFGTWSVMFTIATVFTVVTMGFATAGGKLVAEMRAGGRRDELARTVGAAVALMALAGLIAFAVSVAAALGLSGLAADGAEDDFRLGLILLGAGMLVYFPGTACGAALIGYQRYDLYNVGEGLAVAIFAVATIVALELGGGVLEVAAAQGAGYASAGLAFAVLLRRTDPGLPIRPARADARTRRLVGGFSSLTVLAEGMLFIGLRMDTVIIAAIRNAAAAAPFAAALKLQSGLQALTLPFLMLVMPMTSELWVVGRRDEVLRRLVVATRVAAQITVPVAVGIALFAEDLVDIWLGDEAPASTAAIIALLMTVQTITLSAVAAEKVLIGIGRVKTIAIISVVEGLANVAVTVALVIAWGAVGAAAGTLFTAGMLAPLRFPLVARALGTPTRRLLATSVLPALVSSIPAVAAMLAIWSALDEGALRLTAGLVAGLGLAALVAARQLGRQRLRGLFARLVRRAGPADEVPGPEQQAFGT